MVLWLRGLATLAEDQGLVISTQAHNHLLIPVPDDSKHSKLGVGACAFNPRTQEAEAGGSAE